MNKILAGILAFFLWIFPWSNTLFGWHAQLSFDRNATMNKIISCVQNQDVAGLEAMMHPWLKTNEFDLTNKIQQFYDAIDGNITSIEKGAEGSRNTGGIYSETLNFVIDTDMSMHYYFIIMYDVSSAKNRQETGISFLQLSTGLIGDPGRVVHFVLKTPEW